MRLLQYICMTMKKTKEKLYFYVSSIIVLTEYLKVYIDKEHDKEKKKKCNNGQSYSYIEY